MQRQQCALWQAACSAPHLQDKEKEAKKFKKQTGFTEPESLKKSQNVMKVR